MPEDQIISVSGIDSAEAFGVASVRMRTYYSLHHIRAAAHFARLSKAVEQSYSGKFRDELFNEHRAYITGSILSAVSFLEATINELFADASEHSGEYVQQLDAEIVHLLENVWQFSKIEQLPVLDKYQLALTLAKAEMFDKGASIYQNVQLLITLRNTLVHYKPEWVGKDEPLRNWRRQLQAKNFSLNPMMPHNPFFPDQCLSYGCAKWSFESSLLIVREFALRIGITPLVDKVPGNLATE
jgi:hypothetical protein